MSGGTSNTNMIKAQDSFKPYTLPRHKSISHRQFQSPTNCQNTLGKPKARDCLIDKINAGNICAHKDICHWQILPCACQKIFSCILPGHCIITLTVFAMSTCQLIFMLSFYDPGIFTIHAWVMSLDPASKEASKHLQHCFNNQCCPACCAKSNGDVGAA